MMSGKHVVSGLLVVSFILSGCTQMISIGHTKSYADEHGANYSDAGVSATPYDIFSRRGDYAERARRYNQSKSTDIDDNLTTRGASEWDQQ